MAFVQHKPGTGAGGTTNVVLDAAPTAGNVLVLTRGSSSGGVADLSSVSGGGVTTWVKSHSSSVSRHVEVWRGVVDTTPSATVTFNNNFANCGWDVSEHSGLDTAALPHGTPVANNGGGVAPTTVSTSAFTPTAAADVLLIASAGISGGGSTGAVTGGFTDILATGVTNPVAYQYITGASGSYTATWAAANYTSWDAVIVAFNVSGGGPPPQVPPIARGQIF